MGLVLQAATLISCFGWLVSDLPASSVCSPAVLKNLTASIPDPVCVNTINPLLVPPYCGLPLVVVNPSATSASKYAPYRVSGQLGLLWCPPGYFCPRGVPCAVGKGLLHSPPFPNFHFLACDSGFSCPVNLTTPAVCPEKYYCPDTLGDKVLCGKGYYCQRGSTKETCLHHFCAIRCSDPTSFSLWNRVYTMSCWFSSPRRIHWPAFGMCGARCHRRRCEVVQK